MTTPTTETVPLTRRMPAIFLGGSLALLAMHHWFAVTSNEIYPSAMLLFAVIAGWSLGGVLYPPFFWAAGKYGSHLPLRDKICAGLFALAGFGAGMYALMVVYH